MISGIHHASIIVSNLEIALDFYQNILGLCLNENRPDLGYEGAWFDVGDQQLHLMVLDNPEHALQRPQHVGRDRHIAFTVADLQGLRDRLEWAQINYTVSRSGRNALFCRDPDDNGIELIAQGSV